MFSVYSGFSVDFYGGETNCNRTILAKGQDHATDLQELTDAPNDGESFDIWKDG